MKKFRVLLLAVFLLVLGACAAPMRHRVPPNYSNPIYTVAVLPMYNASNDVEGARMVREEFNKKIQNINYLVKPLSEVDRVLMDQMGITLGSQLEMTNPKQLGEILGVDGVVYGYLLNFDDITTGVYNAKRVRAGFKLVDTKTGVVMWADGHGVKSLLAGSDVGAGITLLKEAQDSKEGLDYYKAIQGLNEIPGLKNWQIIRAGGTKNVGDAAALALGEKLLTKALKIHLRLESDTMLKSIVKGFPAGPGSPRTAAAPAEPEKK